MTEEMNVNITGNFLISQDTFKTRVDRTAKSALMSGKHVSLSCLIEALGKPSTVKQFIWSRNGEDIVGKSHSSQLNITVSNVKCSIRNYRNIKILYVILVKHHFYSMALAENTACCIFRISMKTWTVEFTGVLL